MAGGGPTTMMMWEEGVAVVSATPMGLQGEVVEEKIPLRWRMSEVDDEGEVDTGNRVGMLLLGYEGHPSESQTGDAHGAVTGRKGSGLQPNQCL